MAIAHHADLRVCVCEGERERERERERSRGSGFVLQHTIQTGNCVRGICLCVCVFERGRVCDVMSSGCVTRKSAVRLVTAGWERCVWVCNVDTRLVDLGRLAT